MNEVTEKLIVSQIESLYEEAYQQQVKVVKATRKYNHAIEQMRPYAESLGCKTDDDIIPGVLFTFNEIQQMFNAQLSCDEKTIFKLHDVRDERYEATNDVQRVK